MFAWNVSYMSRKFGWFTSVHKPREVGHAVDEVGLESIEGFESQHDAGLLRMQGDLLKTLDGPLPFVGSSAAADKFADR